MLIFMIIMESVCIIDGFDLFIFLLIKKYQNGRLNESPDPRSVFAFFVILLILYYGKSVRFS